MNNLCKQSITAFFQIVATQNAEDAFNHATANAELLQTCFTNANTQQIESELEHHLCLDNKYAFCANAELKQRIVHHATGAAIVMLELYQMEQKL